MANKEKEAYEKVKELMKVDTTISVINSFYKEKDTLKGLMIILKNMKQHIILNIVLGLDANICSALSILKPIKNLKIC